MLPMSLSTILLLPFAGALLLLVLPESIARRVDSSRAWNEGTLYGLIAAACSLLTLIVFVDILFAFKPHTETHQLTEDLSSVSYTHLTLPTKRIV